MTLKPSSEWWWLGSKCSVALLWFLSVFEGSSSGSWFWPLGPGLIASLLPSSSHVYLGERSECPSQRSRCCRKSCYWAATGNWLWPKVEVHPAPCNVVCWFLCIGARQVVLNLLIFSAFQSLSCLQGALQPALQRAIDTLHGAQLQINLTPRCPFSLIIVPQNIDISRKTSSIHFCNSRGWNLSSCVTMAGFAETARLLKLLLETDEAGKIGQVMYGDVRIDFCHWYMAQPWWHGPRKAHPWQDDLRLTEVLERGVRCRVEDCEGTICDCGDLSQQASNVTNVTYVGIKTWCIITVYYSIL